MPDDRNTEMSTVYFGPPCGFYDPYRFNDFVRIRVVGALGIGSFEFGVDGELPRDITFSFRHAHMAIHYAKDDTRCKVDLLGTRRGKDNMDKIKELIFASDHKDL